MASEKEAIDESKKLEDDSIEVKDGENGAKDNGDEGKAGETEEDGKEKEVNGEERSEEEGAEKESEEQKEEDKVEEQEEDGNTEDETVEKESKEEKGGEIRELSSPRPTRERKTVERFTVTETPKGSASKPLSIEKGRGTQLKDIPNVAFKLSKRKADENLQQLHYILFGKKAKVQTLKKHLGLFSGFVWAENEEKQRAKAKEKIDKCVKDKLLDFCDILNIPVNKTTEKKEELSSKLLEFLESPYATTPNLLAEKEKGKKRISKDKNPGSSASARNSAKKQKKNSEFVEMQKPSDDEESDHEMEPLKSEDDQDDGVTGCGEESDHEENDSEKESDGDGGKSRRKNAEKGSSQKTPKKDTVESSGKSKSISKGKSKSTKSTSDSASKKRAAESESKGKSKKKSPPAKQQKLEKETEKHASSPSKGSTSSKKKSSKSPTKVGEGQDSKKATKTKEPTREEMHAVVADILKEADFNTATLSDILRQLGEHFKVDLKNRKSEIKDIITDVINNMSDDEDGENESGDNSGKDGEGDDE